MPNRSTYFHRRMGDFCGQWSSRSVNDRQKTSSYGIRVYIFGKMIKFPIQNLLTRRVLGPYQPRSGHLPWANGCLTKFKPSIKPIRNITIFYILKRSSLGYIWNTRYLGWNRNTAVEQWTWRGAGRILFSATDKPAATHISIPSRYTYCIYIFIY